MNNQKIGSQAVTAVTNNKDNNSNSQDINTATNRDNKTNDNIARKRKIVLMAKNDTWVRITDTEDSFLVEKILKTGDTYFLPEKNNLVISAGDTSSIEVFITGDKQSFLGTLKEISRIN